MKDISKGYIALFRQFIEWQWFTDVNTCHLFIYCLLRANYKDTNWRGIQIKKGQFITSYEKLSIDTGLTIKQVRTALNKLKMTGEVAHQTTSRNSIITVNNWIFYQTEGKQRANELTSKGQTEGKQRATDNKDNKDNKEDNITTSYINSLSSSIEENQKIEITDDEREFLKAYARKNGAKYPNPYIRKLIANGDYLDILKGYRRKKEREREKEQQQKKEEFVLTPEEDEKIQNILKETRQKLRGAKK